MCNQDQQNEILTAFKGCFHVIEVMSRDAVIDTKLQY